MKVLVTGSNGFIGKNLTMKLKEDKSLIVYECDKDLDKPTLERYCKEAEFIYHLAGINRTDNEDEFMNGNYGFTLDLLDLLNKHNKRCPIMLASSIQASIFNAYGKSKKAAEEIVLAHAINNKTNAFIYRLPNVFGKWSRPNYNSVVATFCHNIARNLPITIDKPDKQLKLLYIDDLVNQLIHLPKYTNTNDYFYEVHPTYLVSLERISKLLYSFREYDMDPYIPDLDDEFTKKLYSTYISYLPEDGLVYRLKTHSDDRGSFTEFIKTNKNGQISVNVIKPGITKGNHYHHTKLEKFLVVSGRGVVRLKDIISGHTLEYYLNSENMEVIDIPPGYSHNIENIDSSDLVFIIWCNEIFDKDNPDTYTLNI